MMDYGTASRTASLMNTYRVTALALTTCVGLLTGVASAAPKTTSQPKAMSASTNTKAVAKPIVNRTMRLLVRVNDVSDFKAFVSSVAVDYPGIVLGDSVDPMGEVFSLITPDLQTAIKVKRRLAIHSTVSAIALDSSYNIAGLFNSGGGHTRPVG